MSEPKPPVPTPQRINIELGDAEAEGIYANISLINQSASEFVLDFARITPGKPKAKIHARIIMTPLNAKAFLRGLEQNVKRFEDLHGPLGDPGTKIGIGFQSDESASH